jgi:hypothetical protein
VQVSLRRRIGAAARGEISIADLVVYRSANIDAYDMLDHLPANGLARASAWCAFVLQTHADNLLSTGTHPSSCSRENYGDARLLYDLAARWLVRAREATASPGYKLDVVVPQPFPHLLAQLGRGEVQAMRKTLEALEARAGAEAAGRRGDLVWERLQPTLASVRAALDAASGIATKHEHQRELEATLAVILHEGLDRAYQAGQLLALPDILAKPRPPSARPLTSQGALTLFVPGDPGFDPWCLTDPAVAEQKRASRMATALVNDLWRDDPRPDVTLAILADILTAVELGVVEYMPPDLAATLRVISDRCPWPAVLYARTAVEIGGQKLSTGDRFVLAVGAAERGFQRAIVCATTRAPTVFSDIDTPHPGLGLDRLLHHLSEVGFDVGSAT